MEKIIRIDDHSGLVLEGGGMRGDIGRAHV